MTVAGGHQFEGNLTDGADVVCDIFTGFTVAACGGLHQHTVFITQAHGEAIELQFSHIVDLRVVNGQTQFFANACVKTFCAAGFGIGFGANAEHGHSVAHAGKRVERFAAHALGG